MISPWIAFVAWVPISMLLFRRLPLRIAILANYLGGWGLLPSAQFIPSTAVFPYWVLGTCLPSTHFFTKASMTSLTCLLAILLFDRQVFRRFQLTFWDLPMLAWCLVPLLSAFANSQDLAGMALGELYQILAWGVPYLMGRLYFTDARSLDLAARAFVIAGLSYVPICLVEIFTGPQFYAFLYGYQPYRWVGAERYIGFRPVGFLEDGNQLGVWMAASALIAICLWRWRLVDRLLGLPMAWVSGILFAVTLLCQSGGSIILLLCLLPFTLLRKSYLPRVFAVVLLLAIFAAMGLRLANVVSLQTVVKQNALARHAEGFLRSIHRESFGWRLSQDEKHVSTALKTPLLGSAAWDWWRSSASRPWGLWLLVFGMYGIVGLTALEVLQLLPVARSLRTFSPGVDSPRSRLASALAAALLMSAIDNLLNGSMILPLLLVIGGLSTPNFALEPQINSKTKPAAESRTPRSVERRRRTAATVRQPMAHAPLNAQ